MGKFSKNSIGHEGRKIIFKDPIKHYLTLQHMKDHTDITFVEKSR